MGTEYLIILIIILLGFSIRGFLGFGFSAVVFPCLLVAGFDKPEILTVYFESIVSILFGIKYFKKDKLVLVARLLGYSIIGVIIGLLAKSFLGFSATFFHLTPLLLTLAILLAIKLIPSKATLLSNASFLGVLAGIMANWSGVAGPPIVIYSLAKKEEYVNMKSILSMYFMCLYLFTFATFSINNDISSWLDQYFHLLIFGAVLIFIAKLRYWMLSNKLDGWLEHYSDRVYTIAYYVLLVICCIPILKYLVG